VDDGLGMVEDGLGMVETVGKRWRWLGKSVDLVRISSSRWLGNVVDGWANRDRTTLPAQTRCPQSIPALPRLRMSKPRRLEGNLANKAQRVRNNDEIPKGPLESTDLGQNLVSNKPKSPSVVKRQDARILGSI